MNQFHIKLERVAVQPDVVIRWCLDFPADGEPANAKMLSEQGMLFQGWCITSEVPVTLYLKQNESLQLVPLEKRRLDVVKYFAKKASKLNVPERCGFRFEFIPQCDQFELGLYDDGKLSPMLVGKIAGPFNIIQGKEGWLYLDNDTNKSVDQYKGEYLLSDDRLNKWARYLEAMQKVSEQYGIAVTTLIAPSKEMIYPQFYPHQKGAITPIEQLIQLDPDKKILAYPDKLLKNCSQPSFRKVDTHWTHYGAMLATRATCARLGLSKQQIQKAFASDKYHNRTAYGDLGNKVYPRIAARELSLKTFNYLKHVVYDNGIQNFGRVIVINNKNALLNKHLLILGSSSSYTMFFYISRLYQTVTFIHTAGNICLNLIEQLRPDFLLTQTNARFVVRPPEVDYDFGNILQQKWQELSQDKQKAVLQDCSEMAEKSELSSVKTLHKILEAVSTSRP